MTKKTNSKHITKKMVDHNGEIERTGKRFRFQLNYTM